MNRYHSLNTFFRNTFGDRVFKLSLAGGFSCPARDGSPGAERCVYCNPLSNLPGYYRSGMSLSRQLEKASCFVRKRHRTGSFIAYFQDYTTTYADPERLASMYEETLRFPGVKGLALCTRPDCLSEEVMDLLERFSGKTFLWVELGVQSGCDETLIRMRRGHTAHDTMEAFRRLHERGIRTSAHVILGFPGETREEALTTASLVRLSETSGVKLQNLHVLTGTELEKWFNEGKVRLQDLEDYVSLAVDILEWIPPSVVVQRLAGEAPRGMLVGPEWAGNKMAVMNAVHDELRKRDTWQGKALGHCLEEIPVVRGSAPFPGTDA